MGNPNIPSLVPNLKRRTGNAGLNEDQILPSSLTTRSPFVFHDASDITDDDVPQIHIRGAKVPDNRDDLKDALELTDFKTALETRLNSISKVSNKSQEQIGCDANSGGGRGSKSSGKQLVHNGRRSRDSSSDNSLSPDSKSPSGAYRKNGVLNGKNVSKNGMAKGNLTDDDLEDKLKLLNSKDSKQESNIETKTLNGKRYTKVESDPPGNISCSDDENSLVSDEENIDNTVNSITKSKKSSVANSVDFGKSSNGNNFLKEDEKQDDNMSEGSSTSYSHELSCLALKSSLSGISCGPSKQITVSSLRNAREVGTQTSLSSGLNEIGSIDNERPKYASGTPASHHSIPGKLRSENIYNDITSNSSHILGFQDSDVKHSRAKSSEVDRHRSSAERVRSPNVA